MTPRPPAAPVAAWLPGLEVPTRTLPVGGAEVEVPVLTPEDLDRLAALLVANRRRYLAGRSTASLLASLDAVARRWQDPAYPLRREAERWIAAATGYAPETVAWGLAAGAARAGREGLGALLAAEVPPGALDGWVPHPGGRGWTRAFGPELTGFVFSGNVPGIPAFHLATALLVRSAALAKTAAGEPLFAALWCRSLAEVDPELGACVAAAYWPGEAAELHRAAFRRAEAVVAFGADASLDALAQALPPGVRLLRHGQKLSFGCVAREALTPERLPDLARRAARDVAFFDQQGCVSPHALWVEEGGAVSPAAFAEALAGALAELSTRWPRAPLSPEAAAAIQLARSEARFTPGTRVWASPGSTAWTVVFQPAPAEGLRPSPLNRFVRVYAVRDLADLPQHLAPWAGYLQTCSFAGPRDRGLALAATLAPLGLSRLCPLGRSQEPAPHWRHDGELQLVPLLRWVDAEEPADGEEPMTGG
ncbi:MAG: acyl-CoA reductase [Firmicutes bacterium]|nr:acyl-CoA reductase [Bacillota bacterium]